MTGLFNSSGPILLFTGGNYDTSTISFWIFKQMYGSDGMGPSGGAYNLVSATGYERTYDFSDIAGQSFHAGADLYLIDDFIQALYDPDHVFLTSIEDSIESHRICYEAERSRRTGETIRMDE